MTADALRITPSGQGVRISVRVQPRASSEGVAGTYGAALRIRVTAPPADGAANAALVKVLAAALDIPARDVTIVSGHASRSKIVELAGVSEARVRRLATE